MAFYVIKERFILMAHCKMFPGRCILFDLTDGVNSQFYNMTAFLRYNPGLTTRLNLRKLANKTNKTLDADRGANIYIREPSPQVLPSFHLSYLFTQARDLTSHIYHFTHFLLAQHSHC
jgi:hypothetical protein